MNDPRNNCEAEQMAYLQSKLLHTLKDMREIDPDNYLVKLFTDALNGKLKPVPRTIQHQHRLPMFLRRQAD